MEQPDKIIVIYRFDNVIEAHIIQSKLDAYGIPCFLSEENVTHLITPLLSGGIRLHIFEHDRDRVVKIIASESMQDEDDDDLLYCPTCHSRRILTFPHDRFEPSSVVKFILQLSKTHYCIDCETQFDY